MADFRIEWREGDEPNSPDWARTHRMRAEGFVYGGFIIKAQLYEYKTVLYRDPRGPNVQRWVPVGRPWVAQEWRAYLEQGLPAR